MVKPDAMVVIRQIFTEIRKIVLSCLYQEWEGRKEEAFRKSVSTV
jgi:hypothetical protein